MEYLDETGPVKRVTIHMPTETVVGFNTLHHIKTCLTSIARNQIDEYAISEATNASRNIISQMEAYQGNHTTVVRIDESVETILNKMFMLGIHYTILHSKRNTESNMNIAGKLVDILDRVLDNNAPVIRIKP